MSSEPTQSHSDFPSPQLLGHTTVTTCDIKLFTHCPFDTAINNIELEDRHLTISQSVAFSEVTMVTGVPPAPAWSRRSVPLVVIE